MTNSRHLALALLAVLVLASCGEPEETCRFDTRPRNDTLSGWNCLNARHLASRASTGLFVTQPEIDTYLEAHLRAFEPIAPTLGYPPLTAFWWTEARVTTDRADILGPWSTGQIATGIDALDTLLQEAHVDLIFGSANSYAVTSRDHASVSQNLAARITDLGLTDVAASVDDNRFREPASEITFEAPPGGAETHVVFQIGWGDCFVDCTGQHFWRVRLTPTDATVVDEWGDEIPAEELLRYRNAVPFEY